MKILDNTNLFDQKYSKASAFAGGTAGVGLGGGTAAAIVGVSAHTSTAAAVSAAAAATAAMESVTSSIPLIGGLVAKGTGLTAAAVSANAAIAGAGMAGVMAALPFAIPVALGVSLISGIVVARKKKEKIQKNAGIEELAQKVADCVFLPLCGCAKDYLKCNSEDMEVAKNTIELQIRNWGYSAEFIANFIEENFVQKTATQISEKYNALMTNLSETQKDCNLPVPNLKKFAQTEVKEFKQDLMIM